MSRYVDNQSLTAALSSWSFLRRAALKAGESLPPLPDDIGEAVLKIATHLSEKPNFAAYTYRDDMVSEAVVACVKYLHNFNGDKSQNAFAYVTQICHNSMVRTIQMEKQNTFTSMLYAETIGSPGQKAALNTNRDHESYTAWRTAQEDKRRLMLERRAARKQATKITKSKSRKKAEALAA